ncbi:MAG TPA: hypothetical protein VF211_07140 [Burkholderiales bacterium]
MRTLRLSLAALVIACAGCAVLDPEGAELRAVDAALAEVLYAVRAPQPEQRAALARAQNAFDRRPDPVTRLKLGALLALLPTPLGDPGRASALLAPLADAAAPGAPRFAAFVAAQLADKQRLARETERLARDAERMAREHERIDRERDKREEELKSQLEALREIERHIRQREERLRRGQR